MEKLRETIEDAGKNGTNKCAYRKLRRLGAENTEKQDFVWPAVDDDEIIPNKKLITLLHTSQQSVAS